MLDRLALRLVKFVSTMWCALLFAGLALVALPAALHNGLLALVSWVSQTFIQLVMLSVIMVGQRLQDERSAERHAANIEHRERFHKR